MKHKTTIYIYSRYYTNEEEDIYINVNLDEVIKLLLLSITYKVYYIFFFLFRTRSLLVIQV